MSDPLVRARELAAAATPGPWYWNDSANLDYLYGKRLEDGTTWPVVAHDNESYRGPVEDCDAAFIAESRELVPVLCDIIDQRDEEIDCLNVEMMGHQAAREALEELNARLTAALRRVHELAQDDWLGAASAGLRDSIGTLLAEVSVTPETQ